MADVSTDDVAELQSQVAAYQTRIAVAVEALKPPLSASDDAKWTALAQRAIRFAGQDPSLVSTAAQYNGGRQVLSDLNAFGAYLGKLSPGAAPPPVAVPPPATSDVFGQVSGIVELVLLYALLRELR